MNKLLCLYFVLWLAVGYIRADDNSAEGQHHQEPCACIALWDPVCGDDGDTYSNAGCAECANVKEACKGECPCLDDCICILILAPVCGVDEEQYDNECFANCAGIPVDCDQKCPCPCPEGKVDCLADPCDVEKCPAYPDAQCFSNYCGGCNAVFVVEGEVVNCDLPNPDPPRCIEEDKECNAFNTDFPEKPLDEKCCDGLQCCPDCIETHGDGGGSLSVASVYGTCKHSCHC